ncbi:Molybdenum cofactor guanylyltransferase [Oceanibacterium hippocampi]|uniref:Molybdenum cofactor guanylyltransferase n=1 Tax=Oceanibacterium hippocampi TaxID=745714 RepID=A0A1Y5TVZ2_9PROT|nr:molybdenum cofactor guanylyltransferase MobA [Oceanibacterium hippocampi]SLN69715.1 Molybdenum cofactor guanylyltransferase [Oceanibacterium hippocampi]
MSDRPRILGLLLAGGQARRMGGGDKCLRPLGGRTLLDHVIARARPQVDDLIINANGDPARFARWRMPVAADVVEGFAGPLAGILTGLDWAARATSSFDYVLSLPTDAPLIPADLADGLLAGLRSEAAELACAASDGRSHPVIGLWPVALREALRRAMTEEDIRKIDRWTARYRLATVDWPSEPFDPFFNANRPADLEEAGRLLAEAEH